MKVMEPTRPYVFMDGILNPIQGGIEKVKRNSTGEEYNLDELH